MGRDNEFEEACRRIHDGESCVTYEKKRIHSTVGTIRTWYKSIYGAECPKAKPEIALPEEEKQRREEVREAAIRIHNGVSFISEEVKKLGTTKQTLDHYHKEMYGEPCPRLNRRGRKKKEPVEIPVSLPANWFEVIGKVKTYELTHTKAAELLHMTPTEMRTLYEKITGERLDRIWPHWREYLKAN